MNAGKELRKAKDSITELFGKIREIKTKAEQSEQMVQDICKDIRQLDVAKRHLTTSIIMLKRLQMLVMAVDRLQVGTPPPPPPPPAPPLLPWFSSCRLVWLLPCCCSAVACCRS